jgi:hypothetical protein
MNVTGTLTVNTTEVAGTVTVAGTAVNGTVNITSPTITGTFGGAGTVPPSVIAHISRTDNPHNVQENQIPDGIDYTLLFENALL